MKKQYLQPTAECATLMGAFSLCDGSGRQDSGTGTSTQQQDPGFTPPGTGQAPRRVF